MILNKYTKFYSKKKTAMHNVVYTGKALKDLKEIYNFIALDSEFYADKVITNIVWYINWILASFPEMWKETKVWGLREIVEPTFKHRIFYTTQNDKIKIRTILKWRNTIVD